MTTPTGMTNAATPSEAVNHPSHYGGDDNAYETIKVLRAWLTPQEYAGFCKGNSVKYQSRHRAKGGAEDLRKAQWYQTELNRFIEEVGYETIYPTPKPETGPDALGHDTRMSDSSIFNLKCRRCGATDAKGDDGLLRPCRFPAGARR